MNIKKKVEDWILGHYLSEYDETKPFMDNINALASGEYSIVVWEPFEDWNNEYLADYLIELRSSLIREFKGE